MADSPGPAGVPCLFPACVRLHEGRTDEPNQTLAPDKDYTATVASPETAADRCSLKGNASRLITAEEQSPYCSLPLESPADHLQWLASHSCSFFKAVK